MLSNKHLISSSGNFEDIYDNDIESFILYCYYYTKSSSTGTNYNDNKTKKQQHQ